MSQYENRLTVIDDSWLWYAEDQPRHERMRARLSRVGARYLDQAEIGILATELLEGHLRPGDLVVVPLMSGTLMLPALNEVAKRTDIDVLVAPLSKHPFVTLSADSDGDLFSTCEQYERLSERFLAPERQWEHDSSPHRVVLVDSSTAAGRDAELFFERIARHRWQAAEHLFLVLVNAIGDDEGVAPGRPAEEKARRPDASAITSVGFDPLYVSHLRFLSGPVAARASRAASVREAFPRLTLYWEPEAEGSARVAEAVARIRASSPDRTHARKPRSAGGSADELIEIVVDVDREMPVILDDEARARRRVILG
jgi:hypothetical protein